MNDDEQRAQLALLNQGNELHRDRFAAEAELAARIQSYELAYRMQSAAPEAIDLDAEPESIKRLYGIGDPRCDHFARQCLTARRLVERGVRFVQIYSGGMENQLSWDGHADIKGNHEQFAGETDRPVAGLLTDLEQRGLLDETLVIWGGEFGRLPVAQTATNRAAIIIPTDSPSGWPAAASRGASATERPTRSATTPPSTRTYQRLARDDLASDRDRSREADLYL